MKLVTRELLQMQNHELITEKLELHDQNFALQGRISERGLAITPAYRLSEKSAENLTARTPSILVIRAHSIGESTREMAHGHFHPSYE